MGLFGKKLLNVVESDSDSDSGDIAAIHSAIKKWQDYKKREHLASEAERKEAEETLQFLKLNDNDPT